jgi:hypothetical protein
MTGLVNLLGDDIATNDQLQQLLESLGWLARCVDTQMAGSGVYQGPTPAVRVALGGTLTIAGINAITSLATLTTMTNQSNMGGTPTNYDQYYAAYSQDRANVDRALI